ncbi:MAG TPA: hypothetical protein VFV10_17210 [Gammaproteobacteria bacterium]|nr:hypothetical protein [Gammaproteobacteria bacterium]
MSAQPIDIPNDRLEVPLERMGANLLEALVNELRQLSKTWQQLSKDQQDRVIDRLRFRVREETEAAMNLIAAGDFEAATVKVEKIVVKDGAKAEIAIGTNLHRAVDRVGFPAVLVMCNPEQYLKGIEELEGEDEQKNLDLPDTSGFNGERHDPPETAGDAGAAPGDEQQPDDSDGGDGEDEDGDDDEDEEA